MDFAYLPNLISKKNGLIPMELDITVANRYKGDMEGLLHKHLNIAFEHIPYIITANGFDSSTDYNGETKILLLDDTMIVAYL